MILYTQNKRQININDVPITSGGQGSIHDVLTPVFNPPMVVKLYLTPQKAQAAQQRIEYMSINNPFINAQQMVQDAFAWPLEPLYDGVGDFVGFMMYLIQNSKPLWHLTTPKGFNDPAWLKFNVSDPNSYNTRLRVLYNASQALDVLDQSGQYRVVDLKPVNMMLKNNGHLVIIDNDSFQIAQGTNVVFHAEAATEEYCPPEFHQGRVNFTNQFIEPAWDYFAFGVSAYQVLFCIHPFNATHQVFQTQPELIQNGLFVHGRNNGQLQMIPPPHNNFSNLLSKPLQDLFMRCFDDGHANPAARPNFIEWRDGFLNEIYRINNQQVTAGVNQPQPRRRVQPQPINGNPQQFVPHQTPQLHVPVPPQIAIPQPMAVINTFTISPGGVNLALLSWSVTQAVTVYVNGRNVGYTGSMQVPLVSGTHQLEAIDTQGLSTTQTLAFTMPIAIRQFKHQVCNGYIQLSWDVHGAQSVTINQTTLASAGSQNIPLSVGSHTLTATSANGFIISQDAHINCVAVIKNFQYNLFRTSAELMWEVWNSSNIELDGVNVQATGKKNISLKLNTYKLDATDAFGNKVSASQTLNITAQVRRFDIVAGTYTAKAYWDIWHVQHAFLEKNRIPLKGKKILPLLTKTFTIHLTDFNGIVSDVDHKLVAPDYVPLMPVTALNDCIKYLTEPIELADVLDTIHIPEQLIITPKKLNVSQNSISEAISLQSNVVGLTGNVPSICRKTPRLKVPVAMNKPVERIELPGKKRRAFSTIDLLSKAAAFIGFITTFFGNRIINN